MHDIRMHDIRNGTSAIYTERKRMLTELLRVARYIETKKVPNLVKFILITLSLRRMMACIRRMDIQLDRVMQACLIKEKEGK